jgi:hypothetical protein
VTVAISLGRLDQPFDLGAAVLTVLTHGRLEK